MEPTTEPPTATKRVRVLATGANGQPHWGPAVTVAAQNGWGVNDKGCLYLTTGAGDQGLVVVYAPHAWFALEVVPET